MLPILGNTPSTIVSYQDWRIKVLQFDPSTIRCKPPVDYRFFVVSFALPSTDLSTHFVDAVDTTIQALIRQYSQLNLCHGQKTSRRQMGATSRQQMAEDGIQRRWKGYPANGRYTTGVGDITAVGQHLSSLRIGRMGRERKVKPSRW